MNKFNLYKITTPIISKERWKMKVEKKEERAKRNKEIIY